MFIATRAARSAKLRRSGRYSLSLGHCRRSVGATISIHAAPTELGRASGAVVTINMPLLTELAVCVAEDACKVQPGRLVVGRLPSSGQAPLFPPAHTLPATRPRLP